MAYASRSEQLAYQLAWMHKRRAEFFEGKECVKCGSTENLELDHKDPKQKVSHRIWSWSLPRREAELAKCQILCSDCHKKKTKSQRWNARKHGTRTMYSKGKCRCDPCRAANAAYIRGWREDYGTPL